MMATLHCLPATQDLFIVGTHIQSLIPHVDSSVTSYFTSLAGEELSKGQEGVRTNK